MKSLGLKKETEQKAEKPRFPKIFLSLIKKWEDVRAIIKTERNKAISDTEKKRWTDKNETAFYIPTVPLSAGEFRKAVRNHRGIENRNHYVRDVSMNEDKSRIRINPDISAGLKSSALNIFRADKVANIANELYSDCINPGNILKYKGIEEN